MAPISSQLLGNSEDHDVLPLIENLALTPRSPPLPVHRSPGPCMSKVCERLPAPWLEARVLPSRRQGLRLLTWVCLISWWSSVSSSAMRESADTRAMGRTRAWRGANRRDPVNGCCLLKLRGSRDDLTPEHIKASGISHNFYNRHTSIYPNNRTRGFSSLLLTVLPK